MEVLLPIGKPSAGSLLYKEIQKSIVRFWTFRKTGVVVTVAVTVALLFFLDYLGLDFVFSYAGFENGVWKWKDWWLWKWMYEYGPFPSLALGIGSLLYGVFLVFRKSPKKKVFWALYPFACLVLAPGIFVNALGKDHWGRPRPRAVQEFGGPKEYRPFWSPNFTEKAKSFPSGHASVGFHLCCLFMLPGNKRRRICLVFGLLRGCLIGAARIAQGGHFITDVVASAGVVIATCWLIAPSFAWMKKRTLVEEGTSA